MRHGVVRFVGVLTGAAAAVTALMLLALLVIRLLWPVVAIPAGLFAPVLFSYFPENVPVLDLAGAREADAGPVVVTGDMYVQVGRPPLLCQHVRVDDGRPRCLGASLRVEDLENSLELDPGLRYLARSGPGSVGTQRGVELYGHVKDGVLTVAPLTG